MYASHFGLREKPFNATPDPRFFYENRVYREAYATLLYGIQERKGFVMLTGEVGSGKTTLLRRLMDEMNPAVKAVFFHSTTLTFDEMLEFITEALELRVSGAGRARHLRALYACLTAEAQRGGTVVLLVDEAQNLDVDVLENLRLVSNIETSTDKLLQIVLVGQPELAAKLADPRLRQVSQRIGLRHRLRPLDDTEVGPFIAYRLRVAGRERQDLFTDDAIRRITLHAGGIPRLINILCDNSLLLAYGSDARRVTGKMVDEAAADLGLEPRAARPVAVTPDAPASSAAEPRPGHAVLSRWVTSSSGVSRWRRRGLVVSGAALAGMAAIGIGSRAHAPMAPRDAPPTLSTPAPPAVPTYAPAAVPEPAGPPPSRAEPGPAKAPAPPRTPATSVAIVADVHDSDAAESRPGRVTMPRGGTLSQTAFDHYGEYSTLALDLIKESNPEIEDIDVVAAGQPLRLPPLNVQSLIRRRGDGSYSLIVAARPTYADAARLASSIRRHGYSVTITVRKLASTHVSHRVEIESLTSREDAERAWRTVRRLGWGDSARAATQ
jgi:general secretion pathway protein A